VHPRDGIGTFNRLMLYRLQVQKAEGGSSARVALFDGKTLNGWTVLKCEATVDNGDILIVAGNGLVQTEKKYGDFVLEFEWTGACRSGIIPP
jgi:hypothetical protein